LPAARVEIANPSRACGPSLARTRTVKRLSVKRRASR